MKLPKVTTLTFTGLVIAWFILFRPAWLGGPAAYTIVSGTSMEPTLQNGDLVIMRQTGLYAVGEIVAFRVPADEPGGGNLVIHRIVGGSAEDGFVTQGDNKPGPDPWRPTHDDVVGSFWCVIPGAGAVMRWLRTPAVFASLAAGFVVFVLLSSDWSGGVGPPFRRRSRAPLAAAASADGGRTAAAFVVDRYRWSRERGLAVCGSSVLTSSTHSVRTGQSAPPGVARAGRIAVAVPARSFAAPWHVLVVPRATGSGRASR